MTVAERLGQDLAAARWRGETFEAAWPAALARAVHGQRPDERDAWTTALHATRDAWATAFERRPATRAQVAVLAIAPDPDREAMPAHGTCGRCGAALPPPRHGPPRRWCSDGCRRDASRGAARPPIRERIAA